MRRPRFHRWIRGRVLQLAGTRSFNIRRLAARAQEESSHELASALLLYAHENNCLERLMTFVHDESLLAEYASVERHLGNRSIERLALRGTPMNSLPETYRAFLEEYERAYHTPERVAEEKQELLERTREAMLLSGISPADLARAIDVDRANVSAYLANGDIGRLTIEDARRLAELARG